MQVRLATLWFAAAVVPGVGCDQSFLHGVERPKAPTPVSGDCVVDAPAEILGASVFVDRVELTWTNTATNAENYAVMRKPSGGTWGKVDDVAASATPAFSDPVMDPAGLDQTLEYQIIGTATGCDDAAPSNTVVVVTFPMAPMAPIPNGVSDTSIQVDFVDPNSTTTALTMERSPAGANTFVALSAAVTTSPFTDDTASAGTEYDYRLVVTNPSGTATSPAASGWAAYAPVENLQVTGVRIDEASLGWTDPNAGAVTYVISERQSMAPFSMTGTTTMTAFTVSGLADGEAYDFQVVVTGMAPASVPTMVTGTTSSHPSIMFGMTASLDAACVFSHTGSATYDSASGAMAQSQTGSIDRVVMPNVATATTTGVSGTVNDFPFDSMDEMSLAVQWGVTDTLGGSAMTSAMHTLEYDRSGEITRTLPAPPTLSAGGTANDGLQVFFPSQEAPPRGVAAAPVPGFAAPSRLAETSAVPSMTTAR